ncbi:MAG: pyridoxal phosphate-dependent aminotransferase [Ornithinimicrobium sp.]
MITELPAFELEAFFSRWGGAAKHSFTASEAQTMTIGELLEVAGMPLEALAEIDLGYRAAVGSPDLRREIARTYDDLGEDELVCFAGAQEGLFWTLADVLRDGGHAVVTVPNYQSLESVPLATPAEVSGLPLWRGTGSDLRWELDLDRLQSLLRADTKVVAVNFPNNPTGYLPDEATFRALVRMCDERGIRLVSDEVYRGVEIDPATTLPQAADLSPLAISINVMSKSFGLPGVRVGWVASRDAELLGRLERCKHYTSICNPGPSEFLATLALRHAGPIHARVRDLIRSNLALAVDFFADFPELFEFAPPLGGSVCFPRYLGSEGVESFVQRALEEASVLMLPASVYRSGLAATPDDRFRVGLGLAGVPDAIGALHAHLSRREAMTPA